jgi:transcriptional regulatory protein RtcR
MKSRDRYLVHITTGSPVAQICLFLLTESRHILARLLQTMSSRRADAWSKDRSSIN